jgi:hypothetical protein
MLTASYLASMIAYFHWSITYRYVKFMRDHWPPTAFISIISINFYYFRLRVYLPLRFLASRKLTHTHTGSLDMLSESPRKRLHL